MKFRSSIFCLIVLFSNCTSPKVLYDISLTPIDKEFTWESGCRKISIQNESHSVDVTFLKMVKENYEFNVAMTNASEKETLLVSPQNFYIYSILDSSTNIPLNDSSKILCIEPNQYLLKNKKMLAELRAEKNPYKISTALVAVGLIGNIASIFSKRNETEEDRKERERNEEAEYQRAQNERNWEFTQQSKIREVEDEIEYCENELLKTQTLLPGKSVMGKLLFPIARSPKQIIFVIDIEEIKNEIKYSQELKFTP